MYNINHSINIRNVYIDREGTISFSYPVEYFVLKVFHIHCVKIVLSNVYN